MAAYGLFYGFNIFSYFSEDMKKKFWNSLLSMNYKLSLKLVVHLFLFVFFICVNLFSQISTDYFFAWAYLWTLARRIKHLHAMQETRVRSLGWEDPLEKEMATHSSILAWRIPWRGEPGGLQSTGSQRVGHDWVTSLFTFLFVNPK